METIGTADDAIITIGPWVYLPGLLSELGQDPQAILTACGFELQQFQDPGGLIPYLQGSNLIEHCVTVTGCEELGLLLGLRADPSCLGIAGFMLQAAPDIETALDALVRHFELHNEPDVTSLSLSTGFSYLRFAMNLPKARATHQIYDLSMTVACKIMRGFCGDDWNPTEVLLSRPRPKRLTRYRNFFKAPLRFDAEQSAVVFPTSVLQKKLHTHNPLLFDYLEGRASELHSKRDKSLIGQLHRFIHSTLITQQCSADTAARYLGINKRTMNRKLHESGTSFRQELNRVRYATAQNLLKNTNLGHADIALVLGYGDKTAFNRSFKRWSGMPPEEWRYRNDAAGDSS